MLYTVIRYSEMNYRGHFQINDEESPRAGQYCLIRSPRGIELGKVLCDPVEHDGEVQWVKNSRSQGGRNHHGRKQGSQKKVDRAGDTKGETESPTDERGDPKGDDPTRAATGPNDDSQDGSNGKNIIHLSGEILRIATAEDNEKVSRQRARGTADEEEYCTRRIAAHKLKMKLAGVEYLFEGEKIIFYFLAEGRVDFRALVRDLAKMYRTRIEMKQIGVRDEARLLAEYEHCGRRLCCKNFLNHLEPVTMRMAKSQKTTLDPSKISGRCGRLMCCLRYEDNVYQDLKRNLPKKGLIVTLSEGKAKVLSQDILLQKLLVETQKGERQIIHASEIIDVAPPQRNQPPPRTGNKPPRRNRRSR